MILRHPTQLTEAQFAALVGQQCRLLRMTLDPSPIAEGMTGTIEWVGPLLPAAAFPGNVPWRQLAIRWSNGRGLCAILPPDELEVLAVQPARGVPPAGFPAVPPAGRG